MPLTTSLKRYYKLTKPGIIRGNLIIALAGYLFGAAGNIDWNILLGLAIGSSLIIASACVYNNIIDRHIDKRMDRTKNRALVEGTISVRSASLFGATLLVLAVLVLFITTNLLALTVALIGHIAYVILYTFSKRVTVHGTLLGTISGATPPVIGYVAATSRLDLTTLLLFLILVAWQMPHFYAIAIFRYNDYKKAKIPVLPVVKGYERTRKEIVVYILLFILICVLLGVYGITSLYLVILMILASSYWLYLAMKPYKDVVGWARKQFKWSLNVLLLLSATLSVDHFWR